MTERILQHIMGTVYLIRDNYVCCPRNTLDRAQTDGKAQNGGAKVLNDAAAVCLRPRHLGDKGGQSRPETGSMLPGNNPFAHLAAMGAFAFL